MDLVVSDGANRDRLGDRPLLRLPVGHGRQARRHHPPHTGDHNWDFTRIGGWALGEGEWDGCEELWDTGLQRLLFSSEFDDPTKFHFHRGCDAQIGGGFGMTSQDPDQGVDSFVQYLPSEVQPLCYNRVANYWLCMKNFVNNPENNHQDDANNFADLNPIGLSPLPNG